MPHAAIGRSVADLVMDVQRIQSALMRGILNNIYMVNSGGRMFVKGDVNLDDLLTVRPNGIVRGRGDAQITPITPTYIGDRAMQVAQMFRSIRDERSGVVKHAQGMNAADLHESATVGGKMMDQALERIELIGRLFAEFALKRLWHGVLDMVVRYQDAGKQVRVAGDVIEVDPLGFREKYGMRVKVGLGVAKKQERIAILKGILDLQKEALGSGAPLTDIAMVHNTLSRMTELAGEDPARYWINPRSPEGQQLAQQKAAEAQAASQREINPLVEAEMVKSQARMAEAAQRAEFDRNERLLTHAEKMTELELKYGADVPGSAV
jgi:hypothetical protein